MSNIGNPDPSYGLPLLLQCFVQVVPKRLVEFLYKVSLLIKRNYQGLADFWKAISVGSNDGNSSRPSIGLVQWRVLLYVELQCVFLVIQQGSRIFSNILASKLMLFNAKVGGGHCNN